MIQLTITFDPVALAAIQKLSDWPVFMIPYLMIAGDDSLQDLQQAAGSYMASTFKNPTGRLESSLQHEMFDSTHGQMGSDSPYAARRNWGFSGMTDRLGRYFPHDSGIYYLEEAITTSSTSIDTHYADAFQAALTDIGFV